MDEDQALLGEYRWPHVVGSDTAVSPTRQGTTGLELVFRISDTQDDLTDRRIRKKGRRVGVIVCWAKYSPQGCSLATANGALGSFRSPPSGSFTRRMRPAWGLMK